MTLTSSEAKRLVSLFKAAYGALVRERDHHIRRAAACARAAAKTKSEARQAALKVQGRGHIVDARRLAGVVARLDARLAGKPTPTKKTSAKKAPAKKTSAKKTPVKRQ